MRSLWYIFVFFLLGGSLAAWADDFCSIDSDEFGGLAQLFAPQCINSSFRIESSAYDRGVPVGRILQAVKDTCLCIKTENNPFFERAMRESGENLNNHLEERRTRFCEERITGRNSLVTDMSFYCTRVEDGCVDFLDSFLNRLNGDLQSSARSRGIGSSADESFECSLQDSNLNVEQLTNELDDVGNSCLSPRDYLAFNRVPQVNQFFSFLRSQESDEPSNWDIEIIRSELSRLTRSFPTDPANPPVFDPMDVWKNPTRFQEIAGENADRIKMLWEKIRFLNSNPMIRDVLQTNRSTKKTKQDLIAVIKSQFLQNFNPSCLASHEHACKDNFLRQNNFNEVQRAIRDHLTNDVETLSRANSSSQRSSRAEELKARLEENHFTPGICSTSDEACLNFLKHSCSDSSLLEEEFHPRLSVQTDSPFVEQLESITRMIYEKPSRDLEDYKDYADSVCNTAYPSVDNPNVRQTFNQYRNRLCGSSRSGLCDRQRLIGEYLRTHTGHNHPDFQSFMAFSAPESLPASAARSVVLASSRVRDALDNFNVKLPSWSSQSGARTATSSSGSVTSAGQGGSNTGVGAGIDSSGFNFQQSSFSPISPISSSAAPEPVFGAAAATSAEVEEPEELRRMRLDLARREDVLRQREAQNASAEERNRYQLEIDRLRQTIDEQAREFRREMQRLASDRGTTSNLPQRGSPEVVSPAAARSAGTTSFGAAPLNPRAQIQPEFEAPAPSFSPLPVPQPLAGQVSSGGSSAAIISPSSTRSNEALREMNERSSPTLVVAEASSANGRIEIPVSREDFSRIQSGGLDSASSQVRSAIETAIAAARENSDSTEPVYIISDSSELVAFQKDGKTEVLPLAEYQRRSSIGRSIASEREATLEGLIRSLPTQN